MHPLNTLTLGFKAVSTAEIKLNQGSFISISFQVTVLCETKLKHNS